MTGVMSDGESFSVEVKLPEGRSLGRNTISQRMKYFLCDVFKLSACEHLPANIHGVAVSHMNGIHRTILYATACLIATLQNAPPQQTDGGGQASAGYTFFWERKTPAYPKPAF